MVGEGCPGQSQKSRDSILRSPMLTVPIESAMSWGVGVIADVLQGAAGFSDGGRLPRIEFRPVCYVRGGPIRGSGGVLRPLGRCPTNQTKRNVPMQASRLIALEFDHESGKFVPFSLDDLKDETAGFTTPLDGLPARRCHGLGG